MILELVATPAKTEARTEARTAAAQATARTDAEFAEIVAALTRRGFLGGVAGAGALLGLAACGNDAHDNGSAPAASSAPRSLTGAYGTVRAPGKPRRVVALSKAALSTLLDVGLTPVGTDNGEAEVALTQYRTVVKGLPTVGEYGAFDVEKIAALRPDLVIAFDTYVDAALYRKLSAIAPTYALRTAQGVIPWQQATAAFADAVDRNDRLNSLKSTYDARLAAVRAQYAAELTGHRWEVVQAAAAGTFYRYLPSSDPSAILGELGAKLGNAGAKGANYWGHDLSYETIDQQLGAADVILSVAVGSEPLLAQPLWKKLPAARAGHVYTTDLLFPSSYSGALGLLDFIADACQKIRASR
ncbi:MULTISPECIES: ABC transporter substrate-binding protein [unclassified Streptomyces]|uniref:ABC transporter substrate-binding protein n=1 Tax=unclassified Streptomyces TaxID=2593676 RepID=UPI002E2B3A8B|nr:ABC transporter substrate-binding protein [Streptomyces sp. NBC_00223]